MRRLKAGRIYSHLGDVDAPGYQAPEEADAEAYQAKRDAEFDLVETEPTTHAGIVALLAYVDDFHTGAFADPDDPKWYSQPEEFEDWEDEQIVMRHNGKPLPLSFTFWIMRNVRTALQTLAVQS